ncbi:MAG: hypothetical protein ACRDRS_21920 [Pseudonocardiaceae bacterium]
MTRDLVRAALPVLDSQAGQRPDTDQDWFAYDHAVIFRGESGFTDIVAGFSPAGAAFVNTLRSWVMPFRDVP